MREQSTERVIQSRPSWEDVETFARQRIQNWFQRLLDRDCSMSPATAITSGRREARNQCCPFCLSRPACLH
jgi:hypothetical protein